MGCWKEKSIRKGWQGAIDPSRITRPSSLALLSTNERSGSNGEAVPLNSEAHSGFIDIQNSDRPQHKSFALPPSPSLSYFPHYSLDFQSAQPSRAMDNQDHAQPEGDGDATGFDIEAYLVLPEDDLLDPYFAPQEPVQLNDTVVADETGHHNLSSTETFAPYSTSGEQQALSLPDLQLSEASIHANNLDRSSASDPILGHGSLFSPQSLQPPGQMQSTRSHHYQQTPESTQRMQSALSIQQLKRSWIGEVGCRIDAENLRIIVCPLLTICLHILHSHS